MVVSEKNQYTLIKLQESSFIEFEKKNLMKLIPIIL